MSVITPNRVAAVSTWLVGLGSFVYGIVGTFPSKWQAPALIVAGLATKASVAVKYLSGSQNWDKIVATYGPQAVTEVEKVAKSPDPVKELEHEVEQASGVVQ